MPIKLNTASGGGVILTGANTASDKTITVPADDGTMIYANSSGNVGIGTTTMTRNLNVSGSNAAVGVNLNNSGTSGRSYSIFSTNSSAATVGSLAIFDDTAGSYRAVIDSSGNLTVGATSMPEAAKIGISSSSASAVPLVIQQTAAGSTTQNSVVFYRHTTSTGTIQVTGTTTAYNTSSDYRLKENIQPMTGALAKVAALKPVTYTWKLDGSLGEGFIAHELAEVVPQAVGGEKDAVNEDGSIKPQGIDTSFLVATLTAAIQEQQQMIETLQAKVAALEAK